ncbi:MAG: hypothetical protein E7028_05470 [Planctomycetaceae bacterium]|nr:hypothetical protein [Planctomycetaceae bacterium]
MSEHNHSSNYERIFKNLTFLESRNPDLKRLIAFFDVWLNSFVHSEDLLDNELSRARNGHSAETGAVSSDFSSEPNQGSALFTTVSAAEHGGAGGHSFGSSGKTWDGDSSQPYSLSQNVSAGEHLSFFSQNASEPDMVQASGELLTSDIHLEELNSHASQAVSSTTNFWKAEDIDQLEKRLCLKIEASRWALERDRLLKMSVDFQTEIEPRDHALLSRARELTNCYLWMNNPETAPVIATDTYEMLADAYSAAASCVIFMRELIALVDRSPKSEILSRILRDALYITATAQSALRRVTYDVSGREDQDQIRIHRWLTYLTKRYSIYVNRHMKKDSLAPKERIYVIPEYIERLRREVEKLGQRQKILTDGFRRIQYHAGRIQSQNGGDYDWLKIIETVDELVDAGIPANDERFGELLRAILPTLKEVPSYKEHPFFINVLMELDFWHENAEEKAIVEQELIAMPPQPSASSPELSAEEYSSVWDEMERSLLPGKFQNETGRRVALENQAEHSYARNVPASEGNLGMREDSGSQSEGRSQHEGAGTGEYGFSRTAPRWGRHVPNQSNEVFSNGISSMPSGSEKSSEKFRESAFMSYANARKPQGFGMGILGDSEEEAFPNTEFSPVKQEAGYSRFSVHRGVPSYASVVSEKAHSSHRESEVSAITFEEAIAQAKEILSGKTIILVDENAESPFRSLLSENLKCAVILAGREQTASENKLAQMVHPGNVGVVLLFEDADSITARNVESYCRRFDKPILRVSRGNDLLVITRQIAAAMTLWR